MRAFSRNPWTAALLVAGLVGLAACEERPGLPLGTTVTDDRGAGGALALQVSDASGSTTPTYRFDGDARELVLVRVSDGARFWQIEATDPDRGFDSPVEHGIVPTGAREIVQDRFLEPGTPFDLQVVTVAGESGSIRFTP